MSNDLIGITDIEIVMPLDVMTMSEVASLLNENESDLTREIGFSQKPVLGKSEDIIALALQASKQLLEKNNHHSDEIDYIIHASCGMSDKQLWSPAAKIQKEIGAKKAFSFDIQNGCNAGNLALSIAASLLQQTQDKKTALIIVSDHLSRFVNYKNAQHKCIFSFSDAASAILVEKGSNKNKLLSYFAATNAVFADSMYRHINNDYIWLNDDREEDIALAKQYELRYASVIRSSLQKINKQLSDVNYIVMNQGDHRLINKLSNNLGFPNDKIFRSHQQYGHLGGSDIFFGLKQLVDHKKLQKNDLVVLASSAVGFSWGASVIQI